MNIKLLIDKNIEVILNTSNLKLSKRGGRGSRLIGRGEIIEVIELEGGIVNEENKNMWI